MKKRGNIGTFLTTVEQRTFPLAAERWRFVTPARMFHSFLLSLR